MRILVVILLFLSACGFEPVYKNHDVSNNFSITTPKDKLGYLLKQELEGMLYLSDEYELNVGRVNYTKKATTLEENRQRTRYDINLHSVYALTKNGKEIKKGTAGAVASYNVTDSDYNTYIAEDDAVERAVREMAEDIRGQIVFVE